MDAASFAQDGATHFMYTEAHTVDVMTRLYADGAKDRALKALGIEPASVEVKFFRRSSLREIGPKLFTLGADCSGIYYTNQPFVWARIGRSDAEIVETVVHECRHRHQNLHGWMRSHTREQRENDAISYARGFVERNPDLIPTRRH